MAKNLFFMLCGALMMLSCSPSSTDALYGTDWVMEYVKEANGDSKITPMEGKNPTLNIDKETKAVSGFAGCNRLVSKANVQGNKISFEQTALTRMFCEDSMDIEFAVSKALEVVDNFEIKAGKLILKSGDIIVAEYKK